MGTTAKLVTGILLLLILSVAGLPPSRGYGQTAPSAGAFSLCFTPPDSLRQVPGPKDCKAGETALTLTASMRAACPAAIPARLGDPNLAPACRDSLIALLTPVANSAAVTVPGSVATVLTLSATDSHAPALSFSIVAPPAHGSLGSLGAPACTPNNAGGTSCTTTAVYTPAAGYAGPDSIGFKANDGLFDSPVATLTLTVSQAAAIPPAFGGGAAPPAASQAAAVPAAFGGGGAPIAAGQNVTAIKNTPLVITLSASDSSHPLLAFSIVSGPAHGALGPLSTPICTKQPNATIGCTVTVTYTPASGYSGPDSFTFKTNNGAADSNIATVSIRVDDPPTAASQSVNTPLNTAKAITLAAADTDSPSLTFTIVTPPAHGSLGFLGAPSCTPSGGGVNCTATVTYTPNAGYMGADSFTFKANDGLADSNTATVSISVQSAPVAVSQSVTVATNSSKLITLAATDVDSPSLTFAIVTPPAHGGLSPLGAPACVPSGGGSSCTATVTYTPTSGYAGPDSFTFKANDGFSDSNIATVTITVDQPPTVSSTAPVNGATSVPTNTTVSFTFSKAVNVTASAFKLECPTGTPVAFTVAPAPPGGVTTFTLTPSANLPAGVICTATAVAAQISDLAGITMTADVAISFTVAKANQTITFTSTAPANAKVGGPTYTVTATASSGLPVTFTIDATASSVCSISGATVSFTGVGTCVIDANQAGNATYNAAPQAQQSFAVVVPPTLSISKSHTPPFTQGDTGKTFSLTVSNQAGAGPTSGTVTVTDTLPAGLTPTAANNNPNLNGWNCSVSGQTVTCTRSDVLNGGSSYPAITLTVDVAANAAVTLTNQASVNGGGDPSAPHTSNTDTVTMAPKAVDDSYTVTGNVGIDVTPAANGVLQKGTPDTLNGGTLHGFGSSVATADGTVPNGTNAVTTGNNGTVVLAADGTFTYNPPAGFTGTDNFYYDLHNGGGDAVGHVTLTISNMIWFIDNSAGAAGDGRLSSPFNTLGGFASINSGAAPHPRDGDTVFIATGSSAYTGGVTLRTSQILVGKAATAAIVDIPSAAHITLAPFSNPLPATGGTAPSLTTSGGSVNAITLGSGNTVRGLDIGNRSGTGIAGTSFGTLTLSEVNISGSGQALNLDTGTANATFGTLSSSSGTNNVRLNAVSGSPSVTGGALSGASGDALLIAGGGGSFTYPGTISSGSAHSVNVQNKTGGTVALSGLVTDTGTGITLTSNTGATITFSGGLSISTGTNAGFTATGGGTVNVCDKNPCGTGSAVANTVTTTTGTALNVANTTIGASGLTFRSISANGGSNGIILNTTTGSSGGLTVTGTGTTAGSGGTIQNITSRGASFISANNISLSNMNFTNVGTTNGADPTIATSGCGDLATGNNLSCNAGIHLQTVTGATLTNVIMNGGLQVGINGNSVTNFVLSNSSVQHFGDQVREDGLKFKNMLGTSSISNTTFGGNTAATDNAAIQINVVNDTGAAGTSITLTNVNVQSRGFAASGVTWSHGFQFGAYGAANAKIVVQNSTFNNLFSNSVDLGSQSTGLLEATINNNAFTNVGASGINIVQQNGSGPGTVRFNIHHNGTVATPTFLRGSNTGSSHSININQADDITHTTGGLLEGAISNNFIGDNTSSHSANGGGDGIRALSIAPGTLTVKIDNNVVQGVGSNGIDVQMSEDSNAVHKLNATILNNTGKVTDVNSFDGIRVEAGALSGDAGTLCLEEANNTGNAANGGGNDFDVLQRFATSIQLRGYTGGSTNTAQVQSYLFAPPDGTGNNTAVNHVLFITANSSPGGGIVNTPGGAQCTQPVLPP